MEKLWATGKLSNLISQILKRLNIDTLILVHDNYRYGYVTPNDVPEFLDQHIAKGEVIQRLWRLVLLYFCVLYRVM